MVDAFILQLDKALRTVFAVAPMGRAVPGRELAEPEWSGQEKKHSGALMRVNHVGEVCAQALYQGQALTCKSPTIRRSLESAADQETEHLAWTEQRLKELGAHKSLLNPLWYLGSLTLGAAAGKLGDGWSLGFLAETERQVEAHLGRHLDALPSGDARSSAIVQQMKLDEVEHANTAVSLGAKELPAPIKTAMRLASSVMTRTAYYL
ncbi:MAG: 2-polyprenyl-3-methyl-6-methoxy-1,4-benzoquinone monooxygenase [Betaproteobacteria bacterium]